MKLGTYHGTGWINEATALRGRLIVTQERIDISTRGPKPDRSWTTVDSKGHFHARSGDGYPTLRSKEIPVPCDGSCGGVCEGEGTSRIEWSCVLCGEVIHPGMVPGPHHDSMPGRYDWSAELEGPSTPETERLMMAAGFGDRVMLRFDADIPERWTFFGAAACDGGSLTGGFSGIVATLKLYAAGELGDRPRAAEKVKAA